MTFLALFSFTPDYWDYTLDDHGNHDLDAFVREIWRIKQRDFSSDRLARYAADRLHTHVRVRLPPTYIVHEDLFTHTRTHVHACNTHMYDFDSAACAPALVHTRVQEWQTHSCVLCTHAHTIS